MAEQILGKQQAFDLGLDALPFEQHLSDLAEQLRIAREEADRIVARRHRRRALRGDTAEARPQAVEPGEGRGHPDRTAGVAAEGEIAQLARDGGGGTAGRSSGHVLGGAWIDRLAVMSVGTEHAVEELVADGDAGAGRARLEQADNRARRRQSRRRMLIVGRIAVPNLPAGNGKEVLHHEGETRKRSLGASGERLGQSMRDEGANRVLVRNRDHVRLTMPWPMEKKITLYITGAIERSFRGRGCR